MVGTMEMKNPLLYGRSYVKWPTRSWRRWKGCSMNVFLQRVVEDLNIDMKTITVKNLVMKILVWVLDFRPPWQWSWWSLWRASC